MDNAKDGVKLYIVNSLKTLLEIVWVAFFLDYCFLNIQTLAADGITGILLAVPFLLAVIACLIFGTICIR